LLLFFRLKHLKFLQYRIKFVRFEAEFLPAPSFPFSPLNGPKMNTVNSPYNDPMRPK
jgi:hypothetical protein